MKRTPIVTAVTALALSASAVLIIVMLSSARCEDPIFTAAAAFVVVPAVCFVLRFVPVRVFGRAVAIYTACFDIYLCFGSVFCFFGFYGGVSVMRPRSVRQSVRLSAERSARCLRYVKRRALRLFRLVSSVKKDERHVPVIKEK